MAAAVELTGAVSLLGRFPALAGVDLQVEPGEIVLLQGPNGAGKTTLLRLCAGLLRVESGRAVVLGHDLATDRRSVRRRVGLLGHATGLYDDLTVEENVAFWCRASHAEPAAVQRALGHLGLDGRLREVPVFRLSAGQRRRTALATLLVRRPELWLLDEPHAALDQQGRDTVDRLITDAAAAGATVLVASHELERVAGVTRRTVTIAGGLVVGDTGMHPASSEDAS
ncbi:MAG: heme ABC exporter ATP-binding protein CcmA [Actinomycetota bacterium]